MVKKLEHIVSSLQSGGIEDQALVFNIVAGAAEVVLPKRDARKIMLFSRLATMIAIPDSLEERRRVRRCALGLGRDLARQDPEAASKSYPVRSARDLIHDVGFRRVRRKGVVT